MENLFINFLLYTGLGIVFVYVGSLIFKLVTPQDEDALIKEKNISASIVHAGKVLGLTFVVAASISNSVSLLDMAKWSAIGVVAQLLAYFLHDFVTPKLKFREEIENNNYAAALKIAVVSIAVGLVIAAGMTY